MGDINNVPKQLRKHAFKEGQSGNPKGRPKWKSLEEKFKEYLEQKSELDGEERNRLEWLIERVYGDAIQGSHQAQKLVFERAFGQAKQHITVKDNNKTLKDVESAEDAKEAADDYEALLGA